MNVLIVLLLAPIVAPGDAPPPGSPNHWLEVIRLGEVSEATLEPEQALVAAEFARRNGDEAMRLRALERAISGGFLAEVARLELAGALVESEPTKALELVVPTLRRWGSRELLAAAVEVAEVALDRGAEAPGDLAGKVSGLPRDHRRRLLVALSDPTTAGGRGDLMGVLRRSQRDRSSLRAARALLAEPENSDEIWYAAKTLYLHGLYDEAEPILERVAATAAGPAEPWEAPFLRGRCAFRLGRFEEAAEWYRAALNQARAREDVAELWVHLARCHELLDELDAAVEAGRQAVLAKVSDDRRLFLVRLRLRTGREDLALRGIGSMKSRTSRARGWQLVGLQRLESGRLEDGLAALDRADRDPWFGPSQVLAAAVESDLGRPGSALGRLERVAERLDVYWLQQAEQLMANLPRDLVAGWREAVRLEVASGRRTRSALVRWSRLEPDPEVLRNLQARTELIDAYATNGESALAPHGLAGQLWSLGLRDMAVRWDPGSFPRGSAAEMLWSARRFLDAGRFALALRTADSAWRRAGSDLPIRVQPRELREALYPLPWPSELERVGRDASVAWPLVAGVAREESRWDPGILSAVGARGLMQLMPATAQAAAKRSGLGPLDPDDLFDPAVSLELGARELGLLMTEFEGNAAASIAAYNAGSSQAHLWLNAYPESLNEARFVASLTFRATRTYTAHVLAGMRIIEARRSVALRWPEASPTPAAVGPRSASPRGADAPAPSTDRSPR